MGSHVYYSFMANHFPWLPPGMAPEGPSRGPDIALVLLVRLT